MQLFSVLAFFQEETTPTWFTMVPFLVLVAAMYFLMIRPQLREQKKHRDTINSLKKGDKVVTNGGIWGEIDAVEPQFVRLKVNEKTKIVVTRSAISGFQPTAGKEEAKA